MEALRRDAYSAKSLGPMASRERSWAELLLTARCDPSALDADSFEKGVAILRAAGYRTAYQQGEQALASFRAAGGVVDNSFQHVVHGAKRSCRRGMGPPKRSGAFPLDRIPELPSEKDPWVHDGPCYPRRAMNVGGWWLNREVELGNIPDLPTHGKNRQKLT